MQDKILYFLYKTLPGRLVLKLLIQPPVSRLAGRLLDSRISTVLIKPFIRLNNIDLDEYEDRTYLSYNDFFTRKVKPGRRSFEATPDVLCSPCDSKLSIYDITDKSRFKIKNTTYSLEQLLKSKKAAAHYQGGRLMIFRLTVDDYHRYAFVDDGTLGKTRRIDGVFHTVMPIAGDSYPVYHENTREYSILKSENFGNILMMEVGALLVGRIVNNFKSYSGLKIRRGQEKGRFEFGGSTVILIFEPGKIIIDKDILDAATNGRECIIKQGQRIGQKA
ncbi:MAG: phosphatidylserine decarboxylase [Lachnospiraceae bacterium]|nr:phosphatidylserine decarboxylase [Lachnospiraceae bacterium]